MSIDECRVWVLVIAASMVVVTAGCTGGELEVNGADVASDTGAEDGGDGEVDGTSPGDTTPRGDGAGDRPCCLEGSCSILPRRGCRLRGGTVQTAASCGEVECG